MVDFTNMPMRNKTYAGANGSKISVLYEGEQYMLKFPPIPSINKEMSYSNSCICEYIGCHVFEIVGLTVQKTLLGTYSKNGKEKIVVACKDFTSVGTVLQDFASLKNTIIDSERNGYGTELNDIIDTIEKQTAIDSKLLKERFWDMFIVDALIGNWDRHNGNWGFLYNVETDQMDVAPIYDCGSSLYPQADDSMMSAVLNDKREMDARIYSYPLSGIKIDNRKINYYDFISSLKNKDCNKALKRIAPRVDIDKINDMIDEIPCISDLQKQFYKTMIKERKEHILDFSLKRLKKLERRKAEAER